MFREGGSGFSSLGQVLQPPVSRARPFPAPSPRLLACVLPQNVQNPQVRACTFPQLCVDVVVQVGALPSEDTAERRALLQQLTATPPPQTSWEVGFQACWLGGRCACLWAAGLAWG